MALTQKSYEFTAEEFHVGGVGQVIHELHADPKFPSSAIVSANMRGHSSGNPNSAPVGLYIQAEGADIPTRRTVATTIAGSGPNSEFGCSATFLLELQPGTRVKLTFDVINPGGASVEFAEFRISRLPY
jgi:hypothetical protein